MSGGKELEQGETSVDARRCYSETAEKADDGCVLRALKVALVIPIVAVLALGYGLGCLYEHIKRVDDMPLATAVGMAIPFIILIAMMVFGRFEGL